ncbi:two-component regulator propeller domain-containing protein [Chitinophaga sp. Hz27]|uniref:ligand-binding sensor domain-containing protein n=1 Tax=Chitinophaga sp. Hz27 TaxID=3347169 RepID=UPI0035DDAF9E
MSQLRSMPGYAPFCAAVVSLLLCCCIVFRLQAQTSVPHKFTHLDISDGLASNHVSAIMQDHKGFIWIASTALQRYDGTNLITVANFDKVPGSIYYDDICLCEDKKGRIWMGTPENIRVYDPVTTKVTTLKMADNNQLPEGLECSKIIQDHKGTIWASTRNGLFLYDEPSASFQKATILPEPIRAEIQDGILEDEQGNLWLGGRDGIYLLNSNHTQLYHSGNNPQHLPIFDIHHSIKKFYTDPHHNIWIAARGGNVFKYNPTNHHLDSFFFRPPPGAMKLATDKDPIFDVSADVEENIWVATEHGGLFRYNYRTQKFDLNISGNNNDPQGLHYNYEANCLINDREGQLWIGTDHGVNILSLYSQTFHQLDATTTFPTTNKRLPAAEVTGIFQSTNGNVYIGYWGKGFAVLNADLQLINTYAAGPEGNATTIPEERGLVWTFAEMKDGTVLVGQENGNLSLYDPRQHRFTRHLHDAALYDQTLLNILPVDDTTVWIGLYKRGLASWNPQRNTFRNYKTLLDSLHKPTSVMDIEAGRDGRLWLATSNTGLVLFKPSTDQVLQQITFKWNNKTYTNVTSILRQNDSTLLVGTDHGLWIFNTRSFHYEPYLVNRQLFNEWILCLQDDDQHNIWLTTQYGFYKLQSRTGMLLSFVQGADIIDNNRKVRKRILQLKNGMMMVGASDHVVTFDPGSLLVAPPPPDVTILNLRAMDSTIQVEGALRENQPVQLSYRQNFITIEFKSLQYHPEKINYYYKLEGMDEKWVNAEGLLTARYTNLPPGDYTFRVKAANATSTFSDHITELHIRIQPAFWQTNWFRFLALMLAVALVYFYFRLRISLIRKEAKHRNSIQQKIAQLEMNALRAQMNPHFIFNALNSIQIFMMKNETESAQAYLSRFAKLIRNVLDNSQLNNISISKEVSMLENYMELEKLRFTDQFEYKINIAPELDADMVQMPTMIVQPFVENAIWHGLVHKKDKGRVTISFKEVSERVLCTIEDNGVGREKSARIKQLQGLQHSSKGLQITRDRLSIFSSKFDVEAGFEIEDLYDESGYPTGTKVTLWFPVELN